MSVVSRMNNMDASDLTSHDMHVTSHDMHASGNNMEEMSAQEKNACMQSMHQQIGAHLPRGKQHIMECVSRTLRLRKMEN